MHTDATMELYTEERYNTIVAFKTSFYTIYLPIVMGMMLALPVEMYDANFSNVEKICLDIGCYFQVQDDFIDCFGDDKVTGKIGTDIQDGKCSWFIVQALAYASE